MRHSKNRNGGGIDEDIAALEIKLNKLQTSFNEIKERQNNTSSQVDQSATTQETPAQNESPAQNVVSKPWQEDKNIKFKDGQGGRVTLSFPRIILFLDNNIKQNNTNKDWPTIKAKLLGAESVKDVQDQINLYRIRFSANSIGGTRKKRYGGKRRRTSKRY
jgi:seryl-tRNA synthetase